MGIKNIKYTIFTRKNITCQKYQKYKKTRMLQEKYYMSAFKMIGIDCAKAPRRRLVLQKATW